MSSDSLQAAVLHRLEVAELDARIHDLVLGALLDDLGAVLRGAGTDAKPRPAPPPPAAPPAVAFLESIAVRGFRGIGERVALDLAPGPGLTLVVGRNGSGKSSFAEALELLLTGDSARWSAKKNRLWRDGWKNLHAGEGDVEIAARILVAGRSGALTVRRVWPPAAQLEQGVTSVSADRTANAPSSFSELGWELPLAAYRPFLSYEELGSMLDEGPSKLFDRLSSILGLEEVVDAADRLKDTRLELERIAKEAKSLASGLAARCAELAAQRGDERAAATAEALGKRRWDLEALGRLALGDAEPAGAAGELAALRALASLRVAGVEELERLCTRVEAATIEVSRHSASGAASSLRVAELLERALAHHAAAVAARSGGETATAGDDATPLAPLDCPVCSAPARLDDAWRAGAERECAALRRQAAALQEARRALTESIDELVAALPDPAPLLARATLLFPSPAATGKEIPGEGALHDHLRELRTAASGACPATADAPRCPAPGDLPARVLELYDLLAGLRDRAATELAARDDRWRPIARELAAWLPAAERAVDERDTVKGLKAAEQWLRDIANALHNERFQPIRNDVLENWAQLRTRSHVALTDVRFAGRATQRRIELDVTVDDYAGAALGVMSQGELHALALALFLPRATVPESPFRFVVVDDPVQAMDPARVDGLARVLERVARERQVVVFTHDERLPEAVRRLGIDASHLRVERETASTVRVTRDLDAVERHLDEARALVRTEGMPVAVIERVVPGLCRMAIEAACAETVRRRRLGRGEEWPAVEEELERHATLLPRLALALFDDGDRAGAVMTGINQWSREAGDLVKRCNSGAHKGERGVDTQLVEQTKKLVERIRNARAAP